MAHVRGLHDTGGVHAFLALRAQAEPAKLTTKLARLHHQRGLLARQLVVWTQKQQATKRRLGLVERQMAEIGRLIRVLVGPRRPVSRRKQATALAAEHADGAAAAGARRPVNLEY